MNNLTGGTAADVCGRDLGRGLYANESITKTSEDGQLEVFKLIAERLEFQAQHILVRGMTCGLQLRLRPGNG